MTAGLLLSELVAEGVGGASLVFGTDPHRHRGVDLLARGRTFFGPDADPAGVAALMTNDRTTVELLLGAVAAGVRLVSLPIPSRTTDPLAYLDRIRQACASQDITDLVVHDDYADLLAATGLTVRRHSELPTEPLAGPREAGFELVQFSSGSTGHPKAIGLSDRAIGANLAAIIEVIDPRPGDVAVSWLPLSHDMGLIGMLLCGIASCAPRLVGDGTIVLLDPLQFLRRPAQWLDALTAWGGSITAAPDFGYRLCIERAGGSTHDLSRVRFAIAGGETIRVPTMGAFADAFAPSGFRPVAFCPAYGMAEVGLAVSLTPGPDHWKHLEVATSALADHRLEPAVSGEAGGAGGATSLLAASGQVLPGYELRSDAPVGAVGHLAVRGPSTGTDGLSGRPLADADGWMGTGDFGAVIDGSVFVTGRSDDHVVTHGRNIYAPTVEDAVAMVPGVRAGRAAVVGLPSGEWIVAVEADEAGPLTDQARRELAREIQRAVVPSTGSRPAEVVIIGRGRLPVTTSGKLQRNETRRRYLADELA